ncbi:MAG: IgGFc-binding protein [Pseudomonadota bacterium]
MLRRAALFAVFALSVASCFESGERWYFEGFAPECVDGVRRCRGDVLEVCEGVGMAAAYRVEADCAESGEVCAPSLGACAACVPGSGRCDGDVAYRCDATGSGYDLVDTCDSEAGEACRAGSCVNLCARAAQRRSNVGCEYWAVDLDNAVISDTLNAAAQQFAVVVSNAEPDVPAHVTIEQDDAEPGEPPDVSVVASAIVPAFSARVFRLGPREVDGSPPGEFNTGTGTALTRAAYRIRSSVPIVAYQFNPLENVNVFSNDASLLKPVEALVPANSGLLDAYVVVGWPQTIAVTDDPRTNFDPDNPSSLRAFLTLVGTRPNTRVEILPTARVLGGGPVPETQPGEPIEVELGPFDVLNLETDDFNADFTGTVVKADGPVVAFTGSEASDAPFFSDLSRRDCCADHLEEQLDPIRTAGKAFIAAVSPNRTEALVAAGSTIGKAPQADSFRVIAVTDAGANVTTTLPGAFARFALRSKGSFADISSETDFAITSDAPIMLASVSPSQEAASVPNRLPGGDPSLLVIPPIEQFRSVYVFLTPDKYLFDFVRIIAPKDAVIVFDGQALEDMDGCTWRPLDPGEVENSAAAGLAEAFVVITCQLAFPRVVVDTGGMETLTPGIQNDGVHRIESSHPIGLLVDGFDRFVSYAYAGGTELELIVPE